MLKRTHNCGELRKSDDTKEVILSGWDHSRRDHGGLIFIDLRDRYGLTQVVFDPSSNPEGHKVAESLRREDIISVRGKVRLRPEGMINANLPTGKIEILADEIEVVSRAETPPIDVDDRKIANEDVRLKYRYLDLRRPQMQHHLLMRHKVRQAARDYFCKENFLEIETPVLVRSTPEGARDYLVPSRVHPGKFYALPQSPQLYKQILMIAGLDRYFQFPICLRDEDLRSDRQPEHTQMDFEMSFVTEQDVMDFVESLYKHIFKDVLGVKLDDFPVFTYEDSMHRFGTDKPDLRFGLELIDVTDIVIDSEFGVFKDVVTKGGVVKCINAEGKFSRKAIDGLIDFATKAGAKGLAWMKMTDKGLESNIVKFFSKDVQKDLLDRTNAKEGSVLLFVADQNPAIANDVLSRLRLKLGKDLGLIQEGAWKLCWVVDFPLFEKDVQTGGWAALHHMFSMPKQEYMKYLDEDPSKVIGNLFDLVLNGIELASGSMRVTDPELQKKIMGLIGISKEEAEQKFGFLLEAYKYGSPPHGGMGIGFDRTVALMCGYNDIREVIAFPKTKAAECPMDGSPSKVGDEQLKELHIKKDFVEKEE